MFFHVFGTMEQIVRTSFNFTFSTTAEGIEKILKTVLKLFHPEPDPILKVTKFLVKIPESKFLVKTEKHFCL